MNQWKQRGRKHKIMILLLCGAVFITLFACGGTSGTVTNKAHWERTTGPDVKAGESIKEYAITISYTSEGETYTLTCRVNRSQYEGVGVGQSFTCD